MSFPIRFEVDPALVADALAQGRRLMVEVSGPRRYKVTLSSASRHQRQVG